MNSKVVLPYGLQWDMDPLALIKMLKAAGFDYDKGFTAFYGTFNWPNAPDAIKGCDVVISNEEQLNQPLDFFSMMLFPDDDRYNENDTDVYDQINMDQKAIFNYFTDMYGPSSDQGERIDESSQLVTIYKAWFFDNLFLTVAVDKVDEDSGFDEPAYVLSLTFSQDDDE